jgi:hypothetical protein
LHFTVVGITLEVVYLKGLESAANLQQHVGNIIKNKKNFIEVFHAQKTKLILSLLKNKFSNLCSITLLLTLK